MRDFENFNEERKRRWERRRDAAIERHGKYGHVGVGLFILLIGVAALLKASLTDLPTWVFGWQTLLIALGFFIGIRHKFRGGAWFILMLIGGAFLIAEINPDFAVRRYIWPMVLIIVGVFFILRPRRRFGPHDWNEKKNAGVPEDSSMLNEKTYSQEDFVDSTSIFGGANKIILSKDFKGGDIVNVFGGTELNLTQADINGKAELEMTTIFGGTKLIIPSNWSIKSEATIIFGGIEDKRSLPPATAPTDKILVLKGTVIFGGIEIKSF
jgi:predicted membrane protein